MKTQYKLLFILPVILFLLTGCSSTNILVPEKIKKDDGVKLYFTDGTIDNGIIIKTELNTLVYVSETDHKPRPVKLENIRRIEKAENIYDYQAYPISRAEIDKYKSNRNTWGYAVGGGIIGAAAGLAVGLPLWYADIDQVPPYFWAGAGAVIGSIYFAFKGQDKDRLEAIRKIRYSRLSDEDVKNEIDDEKKKLEEIELEKQRLQEQLKNKDKK